MRVCKVDLTSSSSAQKHLKGSITYLPQPSPTEERLCSDAIPNTSSERGDRLSDVQSIQARVQRRRNSSALFLENRSVRDQNFASAPIDCT